MFAIEKGIPMPAESERRKRTRYPFGAMEVGDSFWIPVEPDRRRFVQQSVITAWRHCRVKRGWTFTSRVDGEGIRVWRVA